MARIVTEDYAVRAERLGKTYRISTVRNRPTSLAEATVRRLRNPLQRQTFNQFAALDDVSFEIPWGESVGIIGRNGAGKSTLLKILTRITAPSSGQVTLGGRVGSLLEVGTGFHPELTGRENVFLNGALLGMSKKEVRRRFDEIVDFAGVEAFLDTQVKRYSSGMYVRLAFAVAAHLETEILAIDEVLAVGDAEFQAKSIEKMRNVAKDGRTVLFVSHQAQTVQALCTEAIYLHQGTVSYYGKVETALERYRHGFDEFSKSQEDATRRPGSGELRIASADASSAFYEPHEPKQVQLEVEAAPSFTGQYYLSCHITSLSGVVVAQCDSRVMGLWFDPSRRNVATLTVTAPWLNPGRYSVDVFLCRSGIVDAWEGASSFEVLPHSPYPVSSTPDALGAGAVLPEFTYELS